MVEIGGRPILWHIMKCFAYYDLREFVLCLGYRGNSIKEYFLNYEAMNNDCTVCLGQRRAITYHDEHAESGFQVTLAETGLESMTGGRLKRVERYIDGDDFMMTYGDGVSDVNLRELLAFHRSHGRLATVTAVRPLSRFGVLEVSNTGAVDRFSEKPVMDGWVSAGHFVLNRRVFDYLDGDACIFEQGPLERLAAEGQLVAYRHDGFFFAMDTYREYKYLNELWSSGQAPWKIWQ
jgi:glucose-1-phosphate cytidylyltransferase